MAWLCGVCAHILYVDVRGKLGLCVQLNTHRNTSWFTSHNKLQNTIFHNKKKKTI